VIPKGRSTQVPEQWPLTETAGLSDASIDYGPDSDRAKSVIYLAIEEDGNDTQTPLKEDSCGETSDTRESPPVVINRWLASLGDNVVWNQTTILRKGNATDPWSCTKCCEGFLKPLASYNGTWYSMWTAC
jgi:hypothetical protein